MKALEDTISALGTPVFVRALGAPATPKATIARWRHGAAVVNVAPSNTIRLAMSLVDGRNARIRSGGTFADGAHGGSVSVFAPQESTSVEVTGEADVVQLFLYRTQVDGTFDAPVACPPMYDLRDDWIRTVLMRVLVGSTRHGPDDPLMIEEDLNALARRIERHAVLWRGGNATMPTLVRGGLAPAAFHRVEALIEAALEGFASQTLAAMADAADLSVTHFVRAFRHHTGSTPHKYLVRRRMDRAVSLLRDTRVSIGEVAAQVGFSTPAHFVATFRSAMGVTPGALRDALAG